MKYDTLVIGLDVDNSLVPTDDRSEPEKLQGYADMRTYRQIIKRAKRRPGSDIYHGTNTGRTIGSHVNYEEEKRDKNGRRVFAEVATGMDFKITSVGTAIYFRTPEGFALDAEWPYVHNIQGWNAEKILQIMKRRPELTPQLPEAQSDFKVSFETNNLPRANHERTQYAGLLALQLAHVHIAANVTCSGGRFVDFTPPYTDKGPALIYTAKKIHANKLGQSKKQPKGRLITVAFGESENDISMLSAADVAAIPLNAHESVKDWAVDNREPGTFHIAKTAFAGGLLETLYRFNLLED